MKSRLNITVDEVLMKKAKKYAEKHKTSLSSLIESYFKILTKRANKKNVIDLVEGLPNPSTRVMPIKKNLKLDFYKSQKNRYGF